MRRNIVITAIIFIGMALLGVFVFSDSYLRLGECFRDLGNSAAYYFCKLCGIENDITVTVNGYSDVFSWGTVLPENFDEFKQGAGDYFALLLDAENFAGWGNAVADFLEVALKVLLLALPCVFILIMLVKKLYMRGNTKHGKDTVPLKVFKAITKYTYQPVKRTVLSYREFLQEYRAVWVLWLIGWVLHLNLASIVIGFVAYYLWFVVSFDILTLYTQVNKLLIDLQVIFKHFPWWSIAMAAYLLFARWRKGIALNRLRHYEARNCGFINELPIVSMACGSMGKRKTTLMTDMILSQEVIFRQKALQILQNNDMKFPHFPWVCFEDELRACMEYGTVCNLATVKEWVKLKRRRFENHGNSDWQLYGYDVCRYGYEYDDALKTSDLFDVLETYAQAYLLVHVLKSVTAWLWRRNIRVYNRYGYSILKIEKERGTMDGKVENKKYFIMNAKIYARRFATDCFSDYFNDMAKRSGAGLNDYREYVTEKATVEELKEQNSYFINALYKEDDAA